MTETWGIHQLLTRPSRSMPRVRWRDLPPCRGVCSNSARTESTHAHATCAARAGEGGWGRNCERALFMTAFECHKGHCRLQGIFRIARRRFSAALTRAIDGAEGDWESFVFPATDPFSVAGGRRGLPGINSDLHVAPREKVRADRSVPDRIGGRWRAPVQGRVRIYTADVHGAPAARAVARVRGGAVDRLAGRPGLSGHGEADTAAANVGDPSIVAFLRACCYSVCKRDHNAQTLWFSGALMPFLFREHQGNA